MANKAIIKKIWDNAPESVKSVSSAKLRTKCAVIISMAAGLLGATQMDECGKAAVQDMAHELSYDWDPFTGDFA